jgi:hypothetical protein
MRYEGRQRGPSPFDGGVHWRGLGGFLLPSGLAARRRLVTSGMLGIEASAGGWWVVVWSGLRDGRGLASLCLRRMGVDGGDWARVGERASKHWRTLFSAGRAFRC